MVAELTFAPEAGVKGPARRVPKAKLLPFIGVLFASRPHPPSFFVRMAQKHGEIVAFDIAGKPLYLVNHPDYVQHMMQTNAENYRKSDFYYRLKAMFGDGMLVTEGELWRSKRSLAQPSFRRHHFDHYCQVMAECGDELADIVEAETQGGRAFNIVPKIMAASLNIATRTLMNCDLAEDKDRFTEIITTIMVQGEKRVWSLFEQMHDLPTRARAARYKAIKDFDDLLFKVIQDRMDGRSQPDPAGADMLQMLLEANDPMTGQPLPLPRLRDDFLTMVLAGHETTAVSIAWSLYLLCRHPEHMAAAREEVDRVLAGRTPTYGDLPDLKFVKMVAQEAMRLYPPFWTMSRAALADDEVRGHAIPKGTTIMLCPYVLHRNPEFWPDPTRFDPYRFTPEASADRPKHAYFPFGTGPRQCIANHFAMFETQILVAQMLQRFDLSLQTSEEVETEPMISLRPKHGIYFTARTRA
ncbi:MAG: cytochrome P450 [Alphaproteobacteria bacterium]|nr:cytochrome P450 [Alphaproteobacteria bacterium]MBU0795719.1 cytochrome P450 [Alphaproteobacteria bacterium]MBU0887342.1 cytochrome P450 [Alphaproteobacteria bacterium]MBU1811777.1 cytochrome P450 [Alphaproteobacteria bacterium]